MTREWENWDAMARKRRHEERRNISLSISPFSLHFLSPSPFSHSLSISFIFSPSLSISSSFSHSLAIFSEAASQLPSTCAGLTGTHYNLISCLFFFVWYYIILHCCCLFRFSFLPILVRFTFCLEEMRGLQCKQPSASRHFSSCFAHLLFLQILFANIHFGKFCFSQIFKYSPIFSFHKYCLQIYT